jgi:hypothetical protein
MITVGLTVALASIISYAVIRGQITERLDRNLFQQDEIAAAIGITATA